MITLLCGSILSVTMKCLVTGASRGIGWAVARKLAKENHSVIAAARNKELLDLRVAELALIGGHSHTSWAVDLLSDPLKSLPGEVDLLVNAAGISPAAVLASRSASDIEAELRTNLVAPILLSKAALRQMTRRRSGQIIFLSSVLGRCGLGGSSVYSAAKAGLEGFTRSLAREVGSRGIRVNCIAPGLVDTDMGRAASKGLADEQIVPGLIPAEAVADCVKFLTESPHITGQTLVIDNGFSA